MKELFDTSEYIKQQSETAPDFYFKLEQLISWSPSEMIQDKISLEEVKKVAAVWGFSGEKVDGLIKAKKYNKKYNPSCDHDWVRLTKVFTK
jgi:hypothetical protein